MKVSIIVPYRLSGVQFEKRLKCCLEQSEQDFEIIVLPDKKTIEPSNNKIRIIETGPRLASAQNGHLRHEKN